jgi:[ribosomal protein S5]-alanine N-acetyltransferase
MRTLAAGLCTLEPQVEAHASEMFAVLSDPAIYEFEGEPPPTLEALAAGYRRKESRRSPDGSEVWLNWIVRLSSGEATGYVQATVMQAGHAYVGYEFASRYWRRGIATAALRAVFEDLARGYGVQQVVAVLKSANYRSLALLRKLGFVELSEHAGARFEPEVDETVLVLRCAP